MFTQEADGRADGLIDDLDAVKREEKPKSHLAMYFLLLNVRDIVSG